MAGTGMAWQARRAMAGPGRAGRSRIRHGRRGEVGPVRTRQGRHGGVAAGLCGERNVEPRLGRQREAGPGLASLDSAGLGFEHGMAGKDGIGIGVACRCASRTGLAGTAEQAKTSWGVAGHRRAGEVRRDRVMACSCESWHGRPGWASSGVYGSWSSEAECGRRGRAELGQAGPGGTGYGRRCGDCPGGTALG